MQEEIISPGQKIREMLRVRGILQKEFAMRMGLTEKHVSKLINGEVQLTVDVAVRLETVLGIPATVWNAMEARYREQLLRSGEEHPSEADVELAQCIPYAEMVKLGWVPAARNVKDKIAALRSFFEVVDLSLLEKWQVSGAACRELSVRDKEDLVLMAWMQAAKKMIRNSETAPFNVKDFELLIPDLRGWTNEKPAVFLPLLEEALAERGILLVILPRIRGLFLQSASFPSGNRAVIAMTAKKMDDNEFWIRFMHELGHVYLGHVWQEGGTTEQDERDAGVWARNALLPRADLDAFKEAGSFTEKSVIGFARHYDVAPGVLVGRLQYEGVLGGGTLGRLKAKYDLTKIAKEPDWL